MVIVTILCVDDAAVLLVAANTEGTYLSSVSLSIMNFFIFTFVTEYYNSSVDNITNKLRGLSPRAHYTDRAAAAGRRS